MQSPLVFDPSAPEVGEQTGANLSQEELMPVWLEAFTRTWFWREVLWTLLILLSSWVAAQAFVVVVDKVFRRWAMRTPSQLDDRIVALTRRPGFFLILLVGIYAALHRYRFGLLKFLDGILFVAGV